MSVRKIYGQGRALDMKAGESVMNYARLMEMSAAGRKFISEFDADNLLPCDVEPTS